MTLETALRQLEEDGWVADIGQLAPDVVRALNKLARNGKLTKTRVLWPGIEWGTCEKTAWIIKRGQEGGQNG